MDIVVVVGVVDGVDKSSGISYGLESLKGEQPDLSTVFRVVDKIVENFSVSPQTGGKSEPDCGEREFINRLGMFFHTLSTKFSTVFRRFSTGATGVFHRPRAIIANNRPRTVGTAGE